MFACRCPRHRHAEPSEAGLLLAPQYRRSLQKSRMVYCPVDGFQCADGFRFCPQCGTQLPQLTQPAAVRVAAASSPAQSAQPPLPQQPSPLPQHSPQQQQGSSYGYSSAGAQAQPPTNAVLVGPYGEKTDTFRKYADAIFDAIDAAVEPKRTGAHLCMLPYLWRLHGHHIGSDLHMSWCRQHPAEP